MPLMKVDCMAESVGAVERAVLTDFELVLRAPRLSDRADRQACGSHPEISRMYGKDLDAPRPMSDEAADRWYKRMREDPLAWVIDLDGRCVGDARLHSLVERDHRARYAIGLYHPDFLGHGAWHDDLVMSVLEHEYDAKLR